MKLVEQLHRIKTLSGLTESIFDKIPDEDYVRAFTKAINDRYNNILTKASHDPNYKFEIWRNVLIAPSGQPNKCETNAFAFIKQQLEKGETRYFPVGGFMFGDRNNSSLFPIEHWWIYDKQTDKFIEITPLDPRSGGPKCYAGVINFDIQEQIMKAQYFHDIDFFRGGYVQHTYFK